MADLDHDGIDDALEAQIRMVLSAAQQVAESLIRGRQERTRQAVLQTEATAKEHERQTVALLESHRLAASRVRDPGWWRTASPDDIGYTWAVSNAWPNDATILGYRAQMARELADRYGIAEAELHGEPVSAEAMSKRVHEKAEELRRRAEDAELTTLPSDAVHAIPQPDTAEEQPASLPRWDSTARKARDARRMRQAGLTDEQIQHRQITDVWSGPPSAAADAALRRRRTTGQRNRSQHQQQSHARRRKL